MSKITDSDHLAIFLVKKNDFCDVHATDLCFYHNPKPKIMTNHPPPHSIEIQSK